MPSELHSSGPSEAVDRVYYDGTCGLCHGTVRFVLRRPGRSRFRFAPLQGETFAARVPEDRRGDLPDSVVVETPDGELLSRSDAMLRILQRLGRPWSALGRVLRWAPRPLRDGVYDRVARIRAS